MPNRSLLSADGYRYAFQGQEKDAETAKEAFELRLWDSRIGRWLTTDPARQYASPYLGMGNDPINGIDPDGGWKTKLGAWLYKTFNGGGEIVGEKGNWSVAQQGANGWDTFISNGNFIPEHRRGFVPVPTGGGPSIFNFARGATTEDLPNVYIDAQADFYSGVGFSTEVRLLGSRTGFSGTLAKDPLYSIGFGLDTEQGDWSTIILLDLKEKTQLFLYLVVIYSVPGLYIILKTEG